MTSIRSFKYVVTSAVAMVEITARGIDFSAASGASRTAVIRLFDLKPVAKTRRA